MIDRDRIYVDGQWVRSTGTRFIEIVDSADEEVMGRVPEGTVEDVNHAVDAARAAFGAWSAQPVAERGRYLQRIGEGLQERMQEIAEVISREVGMPVNLSAMVQVGLPIMTFASMPQVLDSFEFEEKIKNSLVVKEPVGVVGCITPWNYPLHQAALKVAAALAAGNTVVLKPSEVAPLSTFILAEIMDEAGLPPGTFNLVTGLGAVVGEAIVAHPDVDMVSFTGSTSTGKRVAALASETVKRVALELGGKSPNVILADADLQTAVRSGIAAAFLNSGQTCTALTRMIVPRSRLAEVEELAVQAAEAYVPGHPLDPASRLGPLASAAQHERVRGYIDSATKEGAKLLTGGSGRPEGLVKGYFVQPTVFSEVDNAMTIAREEIFGPVLAIIPYDTEDEAVEIANDTIYGLAAAVWAGDRDKALEVARRLRAGMVDVNGGSFNPLAPFGGYKQSGLGREGGRYGLEEFLEVKSMQL